MSTFSRDNSVHVRPVAGNSPFVYNYHDDVDLSRIAVVSCPAPTGSGHETRIAGEAGDTINM